MAVSYPDTPGVSGYFDMYRTSLLIIDHLRYIWHLQTRKYTNTWLCTHIMIDHILNCFRSLL